jgi:serine/threonine-protein kinase PpkA
MPSNKETLWRCQNYGSCQRADESTPIPLELDASFRCPDCGFEEGVRIRTAKKFPVVPIVAGAAGLLALIGIIKLLQPPATPKRLPPVPRESTTPLSDTRTAIDKQVLARPKSELFKEPRGEILTERKPKNFERFYVFAEEDGWIEVGESRNVPTGWMKAEDTVDWPHSIVVEYGSPEKRNPVLFFRDDKSLTGLLEDEEKRKGIAEGYYREIEGASASGNVLPGNHPVICIEPGQTSSDLYINPVLESRPVEIGGQPGRLLKVTAAGMDRGATEFTSPEYLKLVRESRQASESVGLEALKGIDFDLVFVVDMTGSMQPWVDGLLASVNGLVSKMEGDPSLSGRVKFGLWGYQDLVVKPGIKFRTKCLTPELLPPLEFSKLLAGVKVNQMTSDSYPEDVFAGVRDAIGKTEWRSDNKFIMLIGDAPGHPPGAEDESEYQIDARQVRQFATSSNVQIVSLAIKDRGDPDYVKYHPRLEEQFRVLATNGNREPAYLSVNSSDEMSFNSMLDRLVGELVRQESLREPDVAEPDDAATNIAKGLLESAKVRLVSKIVDSKGEVVTPRDITGWVSDRDLIHPEITSMEPKLLVTRSELNKLLTTAEDLINNMEDVKIIGGDSYDAILKAVAGSASGDRSERLKDRLPEFIRGLPYKSEFMEKSKDWWASAPASEVDRFITEMKSKLSFYRLINENPSLWKPLNRESPEDEKVAAIPLSQLI